MKRGKAIQICGTGSGVGKSLIVCGLCRIFLKDGFSVAPFKAQNMALNSFVTQEGGEIGRAQANQARACRIEPSVEMNPVLLKPMSDLGAQVIVRGKPVGNMKAAGYAKYKSKLVKTVRGSFDSLINEYEVVVIEGAGSPAEVNLKAHDIVNMKMAEYADAPVILVGDIDKGGVFAWIVGTLELLTPQERRRVKGIIINKFRGDRTLLEPGIDFLEKRTGIKVLGVVPYFKDLAIPEEDSVCLDSRREEKNGTLAIDVVHLPHISNFTDFDALEKETDVVVRYVKRPQEINSPAAVIIPGTKNTIGDLRWLRESGFSARLRELTGRKEIVGICGGFQMLGKKIIDPAKVESASGAVEGLGFFDMTTVYERDKATFQVTAREFEAGTEISGYEIHHGRTEISKKEKPFSEILKRGDRVVKVRDGAVAEDGSVWGTYIHGVFDNDRFRKSFLNKIRRKKGMETSAGTVFDQDKEYDRLAEHLRKNIDIKRLYEIIDR